MLYPLSYGGWVERAGQAYLLLTWWTWSESRAHSLTLEEVVKFLAASSQPQEASTAANLGGALHLTGNRP